MGGVTAESVGGGGSLFLRFHGPREEDWLSLLNILPIQMPFHYSAIFIDHYWGFLPIFFILIFRGNLHCGPICFSTRREKRSKSTVQSPQVSTWQVTP